MAKQRKMIVNIILVILSAVVVLARNGYFHRSLYQQECKYLASHNPDTCIYGTYNHSVCIDKTRCYQGLGQFCDTSDRYFKFYECSPDLRLSCSCGKCLDCAVDICTPQQFCDRND